MEVNRWPSGFYKSIAVIDVSRQQLEGWFGQSLVTGVETGLGEWEACGGALPSGLVIELIHYSRSPEPRGYELRCDAQVDSSTVLSATLDALGVHESSVTWRRSE
jgi:hypothetical protein